MSNYLNQQQQPAAPKEAQRDLAASNKYLIEVGAALGAPKLNPAVHGEHFAVVPMGYEIAELPVRELPAHPRSTVKLRDAASFIQYVNDHKTPPTRVFAQIDPARFLAVIDEFYSDSEDASAQANWREFRAEFLVPPSREWRLWTARDRQPMSQLEFAEFLQDNLPDVIKPDGVTLLEAALNFEAAQAGSFVATQRLQNGDHNLQWKAENNAAGTVRLPELLTLSIPVFENEAPRELTARLRYRIKEGRLSIWFELVRPHKLVEAAFRDTWARIAEETGVLLLLGSPE